MIAFDLAVEADGDLRLPADDRDELQWLMPAANADEMREAADDEPDDFVAEAGDDVQG